MLKKSIEKEEKVNLNFRDKLRDMYFSEYDLDILSKFNYPTKSSYLSKINPISRMLHKFPLQFICFTAAGLLFFVSMFILSAFDDLINYESKIVSFLFILTTILIFTLMITGFILGWMYTDVEIRDEVISKHDEFLKLDSRFFNILENLYYYKEPDITDTINKFSQINYEDPLKQKLKDIIISLKIEEVRNNYINQEENKILGKNLSSNSNYGF